MKTWIVTSLLVAMFFDSLSISDAIACYSCVSINGSDPKCEDPMSAVVPLNRPCRQSVAGHEGLFYAYYCSKIKGIRRRDGRSLLIRHCSMDRLADIPTHCGQFSLDEELYSGCIATCTRDWCNAASWSGNANTVFTILTVIFHMFS
ncbi:Splicing factor 4 [Fasciola gigantica]|uniref:Splicing factor 4 n=1 Tax=Fasciola gigantica TaxID=46835 RepID=A0A504YR38_FASGI|nr:Splicing factor 4 [Fasciola gigantica]